MKYNTAVLRSRRLQKHITEHSTSLPADSAAALRPDERRRAQHISDSQISGAKSHHRPATHSKQSARNVTVPSGTQRVGTRSVSGQNKAQISAIAAGTNVSNFSRTGDRSLHTVTPHTSITERIESDRMLAMNSAGSNTGRAVTSAVGTSPEDEQRLLLARENARHLDVYATLPRTRSQQNTAPQHRPKFADVPQQTFRSGISHTSGNVSRNVGVQRSKTPLPLEDSLSHLKISWLVNSVSTYVFVAVLNCTYLCES